jgi:hypothetical protein
MKDKDFEGIIGFVMLLLGAAVVIKIIDEATKQARYKCPRYGIGIVKNQNPCPHCNSPIRWGGYYA